MDCEPESIQHRQQLFVMTLKSCFMSKLEKYHGLIVKHGIHIDYQTMECLTKSFSFEDNINLILDESSASLEPRQAFKKIGNRLSLAKFFRWIYFLVQRTKAARILSHLNGVSQSEIRDVVVRVGTELSVAYEYQLMMLQEDLEVIKLARHAVACIMAHLNGTGSTFSLKDLLQAVLEVKPRSSRDKELLKVYPICVDGKTVQLKWKLGQVFKQPGLRIEARELVAELNNVFDADEKGIDIENYIGPGQEMGENVSEESTSSCDSDKGKDQFIESESALKQYQDIMSKSDMQESVESFGGLDEVDHAVRMKQHHEEFEIGLHDVSTVLLGQIECFGRLGKFEEPGADERRISTIEMDYDGGKLHIEDHIVSVDEDSPDQEIIGQSFDEDDAKLYETTADTLNLVDQFVEENNDSDIEIIAEKESFCRDKTLEEILGNKDEPCIEEKSAEMNFKSNDKPTYNEFKQQDNEEIVKIEEIIQENRVGLENSKMSVSLYSIQEEDKEYKFYGCFTPYGAKCRPGIFGFRGPLRVFEEDGSHSSLLYVDKVSIRCKRNTELPLQSTSPHMTYKPKTKMEGKKIVFT